MSVVPYNVCVDESQSMKPQVDIEVVIARLKAAGFDVEGYIQALDAQVNAIVAQHKEETKT